MGKVVNDPDDPNSVFVKVKCDGVDMFGRPYPPKKTLRVTHFDDYGVLVTGTYEVRFARKALKKVGYDEAVRNGAHRPTMVDQQPGRWPFGLWVGGTPAVAFYF